jgi:hypothetical protein
MIRGFILVLFLTVTSVWAQNWPYDKYPHMQEQDKRIEAYYSKVRQYKKLNCWSRFVSDMKFTPIGHAKFQDQKLIQKIEITAEDGDQRIMELTYAKKDKLNLNFQLTDLVEQKVLVSGDTKINDNGMLKLKRFTVDDIGIEKYKPNWLECRFNFGKDDTYQINKSLFHINVHPHSFYDFFFRIKDQVSDYLKKYDSVLLLEVQRRDNDVSSYINWADFF